MPLNAEMPTLSLRRKHPEPFQKAPFPATKDGAIRPTYSLRLCIPFIL